METTGIIMAVIGGIGIGFFGGVRGTICFYLWLWGFYFIGGFSALC